MMTMTNTAPILTQPTLKKQRWILILVSAIFAVLAPGQSWATTATVFGPQQYTRTAGPPNQYTNTFSLPAGIIAPFQLHIQNGNATGGHRVSAATVMLNGVQVVGTADFSQAVAVIDRTVNLSAQNTLNVSVESAPGSFFTVTVSGQSGDLIAPVIAIVAPVPGAAINTATPHIAITYQDPAGGGGTPGSGVDTNTLSVLLDGVDRTSLFVRRPGDASADIPVSLALTAGLHTIQASIKDFAGNPGQTSGQFTVDLTPPQIQILQPVSGSYIATQTPMITLQYSDNHQLDLGSLQVLINGQDQTNLFTKTASGAVAALTAASALPSGANQIVAQIKDVAGNSATATAVFNVDIQPPVIIIAHPAAGSLHGSAQIDVSVLYSDDQALDLTTLQTAIDGVSVPLSATATGATGTSAALADGGHTFTASIKDKAGNQATATSSFSVDTSAPDIHIVQPAPGAFLNSASPTIVVDYSDSQGVDPATLQVTVNGVDRTSLFARGATSATATLTGAAALPDGTVSVTAQISDQTGNTGHTATSFTVDTTPPVLSVQSPGPLVNTKTPAITLSYSDATSGINLSTLRVTVDGIDQTAFLAIGQISATGVLNFTPALTEGAHQIAAAVSDKAGNATQISATFVVDTIAPLVTIASPADNAFLNTATPGVQITYTDGTGAGVDAASVHVVLLHGADPPIDITSSLLVDAQHAAGAIPATAALADDTYQLRVTLQDLAGNPASAQASFEIDTVAPGYNIQSPALNSFQGSTPQITITYSDTGSGIDPAQVKVLLDGLDITGSLTITATQATGTLPAASALPDGAHAIQVTVADRAGNVAPVVPQPFTVDTQPPTIVPVIDPPPNAANWNNTDVTVSFVCTDAGIGVAVCPAPIAVSTEGAGQTLTVTAADFLGAAATITVTLNIDKTPPVISGTISPVPNGNGVNTTPPTVTFTCSDALSGIAACAPPVLVSVTGIQTIPGVAVDVAGNTATANIVVNYQNIPPLIISASVSPAPNSAGRNNAPVTVSFQCSGGMPPVSCPGSETVTDDGANQIVTGTATDLSGQTASASVTVNLDQTAPLVSITAPADGASFTTASIPVTGLSSDALSGIASVTCNGSPAGLIGSNFNCSVPLQPGANAIAVRVTDVAGNSATASVSANLAGPKLAITSPAALDLFAVNAIQVTGSVDDPNVSVTVNGVAATVSNGTFTANNVTLREGNNLITATGVNAAGGVGAASVNVVLDTTPPTVRIDSPADKALLTVPQISVTGLVNDVVTGTVNAAQVSVTVNGVKADVANRSFSASGVLLVPGINQITATATDRAGNINTSQVSVVFQDPANQQRIVMISGNDQSGAIGTTLAQPLVIELMNALGQPIPNVPVTFAVAKSDGQIQAFPQSGRQISLQTDASGLASVNFQLGSRVGTGNNQVTVISPGFVGQLVFNASAHAGDPFQIHDISGGGQKGNIGQPLPEAFIVGVFDTGGNPVAGVPVLFKVEQGGGSLEGNPSVTKTTDADGRAAAVLVLAQQEGINNNVVSASFTGLAGTPAVFTASGLTPSAAGNTRVSGIVLDNADQPIPNVTASLKDTNLSALTDAKGQFTISNTPTGSTILYIDGSTATRPETYPFLEFPLVAVSGQNNSLSGPIYLPALDMDNSKVVGGDEDVVLTMKGAPGVAYTVFAHSATFPDGSRVGRMTLSQVHGDKVPMAPPNGTSPALVGTLQPARVKFNPPVRIQVPNSSGLPSGQVVEVYSFDHDLEQFVSGGTARVSEDGSVIVSDPGFGLRVSGWHAAPPPPPPPTCTSSCDDHNACTEDSCQNGVCQNKQLDVTLKITAPPDNPTPDDAAWATNFSFLSDTTINGTASLTGGGDPNDIQWTVTGIRGGIKNPNPANRKGPSFSFTPDPPAHPAYCRGCGGSNGRSPALGFTLKVDVCSKSDQHVIKQDTRDIVQQEYKNHNITIPGRGDFSNSQATAHFGAGVINRTAYAPLILGTPGPMAESIRTEYNRLLNGDVQVAAPGTQHLAPTAVVVRDSGASFAVIGRRLITPPCYPNARTSCDDVIGPDGLTVLAGADGIAQTTAFRGDFGLLLNSTWRNPERNEAAGGVLTSRHQFGNAVDMSPSDGRLGLANQHPELYCILKTAASNVTNFAQAENGPAHAVPCNGADVNHVHGQNN